MFPLITTNDSGSGAGKQPQTITLPPPCLTASMMIVFIKCCVSVMLNVTGTNLPKGSTFVLSFQRIFLSSRYFSPPSSLRPPTGPAQQSPLPPAWPPTRTALAQPQAAWPPPPPRTVLFRTLSLCPGPRPPTLFCYFSSFGRRVPAFKGGYCQGSWVVE